MEINQITEKIIGAAIEVQLKTVEQLLPIHKAQLLTYLKMLNKRIGLLINFNVSVLKDGNQRVINGF